MKKFLHISFPKAWLFSEKYSIFIILILYLTFGLNKETFEIFSNLSLLVIILSLYLQTMTFGMIKMFEEHKKGLGDRWVNINVGGHIEKKLSKEKLFMIIGYGAAFFELVFNNNPTLAIVYSIFVFKDLVMAGIYYKVLENILLKPKHATA